jgi:hypothetical protein
MKPKLTPPGTKRLKLECDELLSNFGFKSDLRRFSMASVIGLDADKTKAGEGGTSQQALEPPRPQTLTPNP